MLSTTYKRPLAIVAVAAGLLAAAAGPANASSSTPTSKHAKATSSLKVTMEDIIITSVTAKPERSKQALEDILVTSVRVTPERSKRGRRGKHGGKGGAVTAMYDVRGQDHV
jgi:hypothetical protein